MKNLYSSIRTFFEQVVNVALVPICEEIIFQDSNSDQEEMKKKEKNVKQNTTIYLVQIGFTNLTSKAEITSLVKSN